MNDWKPGPHRLLARVGDWLTVTPELRATMRRNHCFFPDARRSMQIHDLDANGVVLNTDDCLKYFVSYRTACSLPIAARGDDFHVGDRIIGIQRSLARVVYMGESGIKIEYGLLPVTYASPYGIPRWLTTDAGTLKHWQTQKPLDVQALGLKEAA